MVASTQTALAHVDLSTTHIAVVLCPAAALLVHLSEAAEAASEVEEAAATLVAAEEALEKAEAAEASGAGEAASEAAGAVVVSVEVEAASEAEEAVALVAEEAARL